MARYFIVKDKRATSIELYVYVWGIAQALFLRSWGFQKHQINLN